MDAGSERSIQMPSKGTSACQRLHSEAHQGWDRGRSQSA